MTETNETQIDMKMVFDVGTTILLALVPLTLILISYLVTYIPPEYIIIVTVLTGILSQYASNRRVKDSVETVKKWIRFDYLTTILLMAWPVIVVLQPQLMVYIPTQLIVPVTIGFTILSQFVTEKRAASETSA
nr:hypothetical protein [uncultured Methanobacterium sp.]